MVLQKGSYVRFLKLIDYLDGCRVFSTKQVQLLLFGSGGLNSWNAINCRTWLKKLFDGGLVNRSNYGKQYCYWIKNKPEQLNHAVAVNDVFVALENTRRLRQFDREHSAGKFRADAFINYDNKPFYLEMQLRKQFPAQKVKSYCEWYASLEWNTETWPLPGRFARVLIISPYKQQVAKKVNRWNNEGLMFLIATPDEFKNAPLEVMGLVTANRQGTSAASQ